MYMITGLVLGFTARCGEKYRKVNPPKKANKTPQSGNRPNGPGRANLAKFVAAAATVVPKLKAS